MPIARQRLRKHIPKIQALNNRQAIIARERANTHAFLTTEHGVFRGVRAEELQVVQKRVGDQN
jgi:hypothetical protein